MSTGSDLVLEEGALGRTGVGGRGVLQGLVLGEGEYWEGLELGEGELWERLGGGRGGGGGGDQVLVLMLGDEKNW